MKKKIFSLMMGLLLAFAGVANAQLNEFLNEGFEGGTMPTGWTNEGPGTWTVGRGDYSTSTGSGSGSYNALIKHNSTNTITYLVLPVMNMDGATQGTVTFKYVNRSWAGDIDAISVCYRNNGGAWNTLFSATTAHSTWTSQTVNLSGFGSNYEIGFMFTDHYGYGVGIDDVVVMADADPNAVPPVYEYGLHVVDADGNLDVLNMGPRPSGAWMQPYRFLMTYDGADPISVGVLDFTPSDGYFTMAEDTELPISLRRGDEVELAIATGDSDEALVERQFVAVYDGNRLAKVWDITAEPYAPICPDMVEVAWNVTNTPFYQWATDITTLHDNYALPHPEIPDGIDAVYKLTFNEDRLLNARVNAGENGKVALYTEDFYFDQYGIPGPDVNNNYTGPQIGGGAAGQAYDVTVGDGTTTTTYAPFYYLFNQSVSEQLYLASELVEAGMSAGTINSIGFFNTTTYTPSVPGIKIWMGNVTNAEVTETSMNVNNMTLVYDGTHQVTTEWNEFALNGNFAWDGTSNLVIVFQENALEYSFNYPRWQCGTTDFYSVAYDYDDDIVYNLAGTSYELIRGKNRANTHFVSNGRASVVGTTYPIENMTVIPGVYYLVASSTSDRFQVEINATELPCPEQAYNPSPADDADEVEPESVQLRWNLGNYTTEYRLVFGSTYYCEDVLVDWTTDLAQTFTVSGLFNNTNYFWRVDERNGACETLGQVWGFTTHLNVPRNLVVADEFIFEGENAELSWTGIQDRTYRYYNVYQDGVLIYSTPANQNVTSYSVEGLTYNMGGYVFYVTAVYDEGESAPSNEVLVKVSGDGFIAGHVYEQDGITGITNAIVTCTGVDEFGDAQTYHFTTDGNGYYTGNIKVGEYNATADCQGYNPVTEPLCGNPIAIVYNTTTEPVDFILDENFLPVADVIAEYYPDPNDPSSPYVKVYWGWNPISMVFEDFESGDFSHNNWEFPTSSYPWTVVTEHPYEGTYCMKSGGYNVASVTSTAQVTINVQRDGLISFYSYISCESSFDKGTFYIDGTQAGTVTGLGNTWVEKVYPITAGTHTLQWTYTKDSSVNSGEDAWFVDYISFQNNAAAATANREFKHFRVYRTNCYEEGPYTEDNTVVLACELQDTVYIDVSWPDAAPGVYKWGVGVVYEGNRESEITWSDPTPVVPTVEPETATRSELTVYDGGATNGTVPTNGLWADAYLKCEYIMPAAQLAAMNGSDINKMKFYISSPATGDWGAAYFRVFMKEVAATTISAYTGYADATVVYQGPLDGTQDVMEVNFTTPYHYNGGNLLIGFYNENEGTYHSCYFYGESMTGTAVQGYSYTSLDAVTTNVTDFLPKTTFTYGGGGGSQGGGVIAGNDPIQEPRESPIAWSNCLDKDMYLDGVSVNVVLNSADSPAGVQVSFTNLLDEEQALYPIAPIILDESGFYAFDSFRRGDYKVDVTFDGYYPIEDYVSIWDNTALRYVMTEILAGVENVYVSRTGWAMWDAVTPTPGPTPPGPTPGGDTEFTEGFEGGLNGWHVLDAASSEASWMHSDDNPGGYDYTTLAHTGTGFAMGYSYVDYMGAYDIDSYLYTPQKYSITSSSVLTFWADNANDSYPENFSVCIATADNPTVSDFTQIWGGGAKARGEKAAVRHDANRYENWRQHTIDLSAYAGQEVYIAFHDVNYDAYEIWIDDVQLTSGATRDGERHLQYYKVMCTSIDGVPIFNHNTVYPGCQLSTNEPYNAPLVEGEHYLCKVACMYSTGLSEWSTPVEWQYEPCDHWGPVDFVELEENAQGNHIHWEFEHGFNPYGGDVPPTPPTPGENATITLTCGDVWGDGSGYQMLLDPTHSLYGTVIPTTGALSTNCTGNESIYAQFEYKIPVNADGNCSTTNIVYNNSVSIEVPAGVYDWCVTNPTPYDRIWIASSNGNVGGRQDDYTFEAGKTYEFTVSLDAASGNDATNVVISGGAKNMMAPLPCGEVKNIDDVTPVQVSYTVLPSFNQFNSNHAIESGMVTKYIYALNITDISNYDERIYLLHNLMNDARFDVMKGEADGMFLISEGKELENEDLETAIKNFRREASRQFASIDKFDASQMANAYKAAMPSSFVNSLMMDLYIASRQNNLCELADPFCTDNGMYEFPAGVNAGSGETGPDYDCLYTTPNPAWYYMRIGEPGDMDIYMYSTPGEDIDFCCWGPFDDPITPCPYGLTSNKVVSCSYSAAPTENCIIPATAQTGEYYILVITNYSNDPCNINFSKVSGSGTTDCGILPPVDIIGFLITRDGEYLDIVGATVRDYTDIDEFGEHVYCVRPIYPGPAELPDNNIYFSMGCPVCSVENCAAPSHLEGTYEWRNGQYGALLRWVVDSRDIVAYNIYRSTNGVDYEKVGAINGNNTEYFDAVEVGTYYYQVTGVSECGESVPALTAEGADFVIVTVTGIEENGGVTMYPNPTNGNVKIVANAMNHITVVNSLGQVVYDMDVDADEMSINMAQFNAGIFTVRIATESGVSVQRLTVVR